MAKFPPVKRLALEDYGDCPKEFRGTLEKLFFVLNGFLGAVYDALAGQLTVPDNVAAQFKTFDITAGAAATNNATKFTHTLKSKPQACYVVKAEEIAGTTVALTSPVFVSWHVSTTPSMIEIDAISGLTNTKKYRITVKVE